MSEKVLTCGPTDGNLVTLPGPIPSPSNSLPNDNTVETKPAVTEERDEILPDLDEPTLTPDQGAPKRRARNLHVSEKLRLLELTFEYRKNWERVLGGLHSQHLCTDLTSAAQVRKAFNSMNGASSCFKKDYQPPALQTPKKASPAEQEAAQTEYERRIALEKKQHTECIQLLEKINKEENMVTLNMKEDEIRKKMKEEKDEQKAARQQQHRNLLARAEQEAEQRAALVSNIADLSTTAKTMAESQKAMVDLFSAFLRAMKQ